MEDTDFRLFEDLEKYLFDRGTKRFHSEGSIGAFDFFCIIIWKAERVKTTIADNIKKIGKSSNLDEICHKITGGIYSKDGHRDRLEFLLKDWKFRLPTASAILTVLYPEDFTVYDRRVCETFKEFKKLDSKTNTEEIVNEYFSFLKAVIDCKDYPSPGMSLRDKDRFLWGRSFCTDLKRDIERGFPKKEKKEQKQT